jgi:hypothetical protein
LTLLGETAKFSAVAFSADSRRLAVIDKEENAVLVWDTSSLTPELLVQREATSLVRFLLARPSTRQEVLACIQADRTISEPVRRQALALAESAAP